MVANGLMLEKPFTPEKLIEFVEIALSRIERR